jgi:endonuclease YncB( thermonuclease family)
MILNSKKQQSIFWRIIGAVITAFVFWASIANAQTIQGNITRVIDADTVQFRLKSGKYITARLVGIDAPEKMQDFGKDCSELLFDEVKGKTVNGVIDDVDQYKRTLVRFNSATVPDYSLWLIQNGCAWEYLAPLDLRTSYESAELTAKNNDVGLWINPNPIKPSVWRQMKRLGLL